MDKGMRKKDNVWTEQRGQTGAEVLAGLSAVLGTAINFTSHPITRFLTIESILALDSAVAYFTNWQGAIGASLAFLFKGITGIDVPIETWELLIAYPCVELIIWMISNGRQ